MGNNLLIILPENIFEIFFYSEIRILLMKILIINITFEKYILNGSEY